MNKIIINAQNIHSGGGYVLLIEFLKSLDFTDTIIIVCIDARCKLNDFPKNVNIVCKVIGNNIVSRILNEIFIYRISLNCNLYISFTNIPSLLKLKCKSILFLQNKLLVSNFIHKPYNYSLILKVFIERILLKFFNKNLSSIYVQSNSMKYDLIKLGVDECRIKIAPFANNFNIKKCLKKQHNNECYTFIYPASLLPHKNHINLFKALNFLYLEGFNFKLFVTLENNVLNNFLFKNQLYELIEKELVINIGHVSHEEIIKYYLLSDALIYPSYSESFGLPLYEARVLGLPVIASELDYIRDIVRPAETFDPNSYISISRAITRFMLCGVPLQEVITPSDFYESLKNEFN